MSDLTQQQLQEFYDKYRNYQADVITISLSLHDLIKMVRNVKIKDESNYHMGDE